MAIGLSKNILGYIQTFMDFEIKNRKVDLQFFHVWPSVRKGPDTQKLFLFFFSVEFCCGHFKPIRDEQLSKVKILGQFGWNRPNRQRSTLTPLLRVDMRSKKINRHHIVWQNFMENPKIITVFNLENLHFGPKWFLKKTALKSFTKKV